MDRNMNKELVALEVMVGYLEKMKIAATVAIVDHALTK